MLTKRKGHGTKVDYDKIRQDWIDYALRNKDKQLFNMMLSSGWKHYLRDRYVGAFTMVTSIKVEEEIE